MQIITGNKFKKICDYILDEKGFNKTEVTNEIPIYFIKTDFLSLFFTRYKPNHEYKIITHNSDYPIDIKFMNILEDVNLVYWFGQNINFEHKKLKSIPIGIANEMWDHGNEEVLLKIINQDNKKSKIIHCSFDINTNRYERIQCVNSMNRNNLVMYQREKFEDYLTSLSNSFFTLSPNGNGIDCHKLWESLYLKTVPVVTKSINIDFYKHLPIYVIDSWSHFNINDLTEDLYYDIIKKHNIEKISLDYYLNKIIK